MKKQRSDYPPELEPGAVYHDLAALRPGDAVPAHIYVSDYSDGTIPDWRIHHREEHYDLFLLIAFDMSNTYGQLSLFDDADTVHYPAVRILSSQRKTLCSAVVEFSGIEPEHWPNKLCDMLQQAKIAIKAMIIASGVAR